MNINETLAAEFSLKPEQVEKTVELIDEGNTIPFIARYRKEVTGSLDDTVLRDLFDRLTFLRNLQKRKEEVSALIAGQEKMTPEIQAAIDAAKTITEVEDIYRPFRPHRKTRASVARERGLEPLAELLMAQEKTYTPSIEEQAATYINEEKGVATVEDALQGARDIIAEDISDNAEYRKELRALTFNLGMLVTKGAKEEDSVYSQYYDFSEALKKIAPHRVLAINRGEKEEYLKVTLTVDEDTVLRGLRAKLLKTNGSPATPHVAEALTDGYERLIAPSIEREIRSDIFDNACEGAIKVFADNLSHLLMQSPLKGKTVLGFDPGYAHGCKLAVVDKTGKVVDTGVIYPVKPRQETEKSKAVVKRMISRHHVDVIAIGNGTASKESEIFIAGLLKEIDADVKSIPRPNWRRRNFLISTSCREARFPLPDACRILWRN